MNKYIIALQQMGEILGEELINKDNLWLEHGRLFIGEDGPHIPGVHQNYIRCPDCIAEPLLRMRLLDSIFTWGYDKALVELDEGTLYIQKTNWNMYENFDNYTDAAQGIYDYWKANK